MYYRPLLILIPISILLAICSCQQKPAPPKSSNQVSAKETTISDLSEEQMAMQRATDHWKIGTTPEKIINHLRKASKYADLLKYTEARSDVKKLDFNTFLVSNYFWVKEYVGLSLIYIVQHDSIRYGLASSADIKGFGKKEFVRDDAFLNDYLSKHNDLYHTHKKRQDFIDELIRQDEPIKLCAGYSKCVYGDREILFFQAVKRSDYGYVLNLLTSINPENQALGIIGMEKLKSKGLAIDENILKIIEHLKTRNTSVSYHITCVSGQKKLNRFLASDNWNKTLDMEIDPANKTQPDQ